MKNIFLTILEIAESFNKTNQPDPTRPGPTITLFDGLFLGKYRR